MSNLKTLPTWNVKPEIDGDERIPIGPRLCITADKLGAAFMQGLTANYKGSLDALAHSDCSLYERVDALETLLTAVLSGKVLIPELQVKRLGVWDDNNLIVTGAGSPSKAPDRAGQLYIDTTSGAVYKSTGNKAVSDWKNV